MGNSSTEPLDVRELDLPALSEMFGRVPYGRVILALYDPDSQYSSLMVNVAAGHLKANGDLLYLVSSRPVAEIRKQFNDLGVNIAEYEAKDNAVLFDAYSALVGVKSTEKFQTKTSNLSDVSIVISESAPQWPAGTLVVNESFSNFPVSQQSMFARFSRKVVGVWRAQGTVMIVGMAVDIYPPEFYQEMKLVADGTFEVKIREQRGEIINSIRARGMKGQRSDSRWRQILFDDKMRASLQLIEQQAT